MILGFKPGFTFMSLLKRIGILVSVSLLLAACIDPNKHALEIGGPPLIEAKAITSLRTVQSRNFDTLKHEALVLASAATLQDLGFTIGEASKEFGVLVGSKERDAVEAGQVAFQVALTILAALGGSSHNAVYDQTQKINATVLVQRIDGSSSHVRVFFDRHITNNYGQLWKADLILDEEIYKQFFEKLHDFHWKTQ